MRARHEFTSDKKYYEYIKVHASIEFIKAAIMADDSEEENDLEVKFKGTTPAKAKGTAKGTAKAKAKTKM